jgi:hypothetical protein
MFSATHANGNRSWYNPGVHAPKIQDRHRRKFLMIEIHRNLEDEKIGQG